MTLNENSHLTNIHIERDICQPYDRMFITLSYGISTCVSRASTFASLYEQTFAQIVVGKAQSLIIFFLGGGDSVLYSGKESRLSARFSFLASNEYLHQDILCETIQIQHL